MKYKSYKSYLVRWNLLLLDYVKINFDKLVRNGKVILRYNIRKYVGKLLIIGVRKLGN